MKRVALISLNNRGYYSPALYLLRDYALKNDNIRSGYHFSLIETGIIIHLKKRFYQRTTREFLRDLMMSFRRPIWHNLLTWARVQLKYSASSMRMITELLWWWTFFRVVRTRPQVVGFSCYIWNVGPTLRMARLLKRLFPRMVIVLGGQEVTNSAGDFIREHPYIDFVIDGEGEETFVELLLGLLRLEKSQVRNVPGLMGPLDASFQKRMPIDNLDSIPSLFKNFRDDPEALRKIGLTSTLGYMVETARGCPFRCSFCFESDKFNSVRHFPLARIADEIIGMSFLGIRKFHILDPVLCNSDNDRLKELAGAIRQAQAKGPTDFVVEVYAELLREDMMDSLDVFNSFDVGLQTCNPHVLKKINRYFNKEKFLHGIELLKKHKMFFSVYLIYGLPGETFFSFIKSIQFVLSLGPSQMFINHLCVLRGTPLRMIASREQLVFDPFPPYHMRSTGTMPASDVIACTNLCKSLQREFGASLKGGNHAQI